LKTDLKQLEKVEIIGLKLPEITPGTNLAEVIVKQAKELGVNIKDGDVIVVTSKVLLKAKGIMYRLDDIRPSFTSKIIAKITGKDPKEVELILKASKDVVAYVPFRHIRVDVLRRITKNLDDAMKLLNQIPSLLVTVTRQGLIALDGGVDYSNLPPGYAIANVIDFDEAARELREKIEKISGKKVAVVISDTETNTSGKLGTVDVAVGSSGIKPVTPNFASRDLYGKPKFGGIDIVVDEVSSAAALVMGQTSESVPVVIVRGLKYERSDEGVKDYVIGIRGISLSVIIKTLLIKLIYRLLYR
jgi:coenzyme F420-0:L-glutamate ligase/coenzyme F420-1:gamma-L-glutamate ligase